MPSNFEVLINLKKYNNCILYTDTLYGVLYIQCEAMFFMYTVPHILPLAVTPLNTTAIFEVSISNRFFWL